MATERTPLTARGDGVRAKSRLVKIAAAGAIVVALVVGVAINTLTKPSTKSTTKSTTASPAGSSVSSPPLINGSEPWSCGSTPYDAGYVKLANKKGDYFYYWFVESSSREPDKDPLVLWLTGGAGGSSLSALLTENGPCTVSDDGLSTSPNPYSWTQHANVVWLDQPTSVGFSYSTAIDEDADVHDLKAQIGENIYWFLQGFLDKHPEFAGRAFFITGESYAGHYIPSAAHFILRENKKIANADNNDSRRHEINLQGIAIGNGLVDPITQYAHYVDVAETNSYNITVLTEQQIQQMRVDSQTCVTLTKQCQQSPKEGSLCADAMHCLNDKLVLPYAVSGRNNYDLRRPCVLPERSGSITVCGLDYARVQTYLSQPQVLAALHVASEADDWVVIRPAVAERFVADGDFLFSYTDFVTEILDAGLRVLVYNGDADLMCNWKGADVWTKALEWKGKAGFNAATERAFVVGGNGEGGTVRSFENFSFLRVFNSGHMVPQDQPAVSLEMLNQFLRNEPL